MSGSMPLPNLNMNTSSGANANPIANFAPVFGDSKSSIGSGATLAVIGVGAVIAILIVLKR